jgi:hypothetical protein
MYTYLQSKVDCFVFFVAMRSSKPGHFRPVLGIFGKLSMRRGALAWFHDVWTCVVKFLNIE